MTGVRIGGVVLAGGRSVRMGRDKAVVDWFGVPLVSHVAALVRASVGGPVVVVAGVAQVLPGLPVGIEVAADEAPDQGPLEGLAVGLAQLDGRAEAALVTGVDAALLVPALASRLASALGAAEIAAGVVAGWPQPLPAVYRVALAPRARALRLEGRSALRDLLAAVAVARVEEPQLRDADPELDSFRRLNTQDELERARAAARAAGEPL